MRLLHLSFRDFLLESKKAVKSPFHVDEKETHEKLLKKCLQTLSKPGCLKKDICNLQKPGTLRSEIHSHTIHIALPAEVKYACQYWVYHLKESERVVKDNYEVDRFLRGHFLHWLEVMSLLGQTSESIMMITTLLSICKVSMKY